MSIPWDHRPTTYLPPESRHKESCRECDEPWPCQTFSNSVNPENLAWAVREADTHLRFLRMAIIELQRRKDDPDAGVLAKV